MRKLRHIRRTEGMKVEEATIHGGYGTVTINGWTGSVVWGADEDGWEHVSVTPDDEEITPSWDDMCRLKNIFFDEEEAVLQIHPPRRKYVNLMQNCMHLWRPKGGIHGMNPEWDEEGVDDGTN